MGIIPSEILIKSFIEASLYDLRKNEWIIEDIFCDLVTDPLSKDTHGWKEVKEAIEWFKNNDIPVYESYRIGDTPNIPCITVEREQSAEKINRTNLGDQGFITKEDPTRFNKQIRKVYDDFSPVAYNPIDGYITMPSDLTTEYVVGGMYVVSIRTGHAYEITGTVSDKIFQIDSNIYDEDFTSIFIAPKSQLYNVHREVSYFQETFNIGVHTQSRIVTCMWLSQIMTYIMLRYKEAYLEARGFEISTVQSGPIYLNDNFKPENIFSRYFTLSGDCQATWIKFAAPQLDQIKVNSIAIIDGTKTPEGFREPINKEGWIMEEDQQEVNINDIALLGEEDPVGNSAENP